MNNEAGAEGYVRDIPDTIWYARCPVPTAAGIAIQKGWLDAAFAEDSIKIRSLRHSQDPEIRQSHYTHSLDNSFRQGGNGPALYARSDDKDTVLLGLHWVPQYQAILSLPESGVTSLKELKGRRLALPRRVNDPIDYWRATAMQGYQNILRHGGLDLDDVELVDLPITSRYVDTDVQMRDDLPPAARTVKLQTREMTALLRGEVDAMFAYSVWGAEVRSQIGAVEVFSSIDLPLAQQINNEAPATLTVSGGIVRRHPELVSKYLEMLVSASAWAKQHSDAARRAMAIETGAAEYWLELGVGQDFSQRLDFSFNEDLMRALDRRKSFLIEFGFMKNDFDIWEWADPRPLESALGRKKI